LHRVIVEGIVAWGDDNVLIIRRVDHIIIDFDLLCDVLRIQHTDRNAVMSVPLSTSKEILEYVQNHTTSTEGYDFDVVGIDEAQFFGMDLVEVCNQLANNGVRVIIAGLDMDFQCTPFGPIPALCAVADEVTKVHAICVKCGALAYVSHRLVHDQNQVLIGEQTEYEPLCRECYKKATNK
jgi:thymidine kinase